MQKPRRRRRHRRQTQISQRAASEKPDAIPNGIHARMRHQRLLVIITRCTFNMAKCAPAARTCNMGAECMSADTKESCGKKLRTVSRARCRSSRGESNFISAFVRAPTTTASSHSVCERKR